MKTDTKGCSTCPPGEERCELFMSSLNRELVQYDYRLPSGVLFSCVAVDLATARQKRDKWLADQVDPWQRL